MLRRHRHRFLLIILMTVTVFGFVAIAAKLADPSEAAAQELYQDIMATSVTSLSEVSDLYAWEWLDFLPMSLPFKDSFLQTAPTPVPLILPKLTRQWDAAYSASFIDGLVPVVKEGITVFPIQILLDSERAQVSIYNAKSELIQTIPIDPEFLPVELAKECFGDASVAVADRMQLCVDLILEADVDLYVALQMLKAEAVLSKVPEIPIVMKAYVGPPVTNITFTAIEKKTNGVMVTIAYPSGYTNRLELFKCDDLVGFWWKSYGVSNVNSSTNWIEWTDTGATNGGGSKCFYAAGNADVDSDSDLLTDAQEKFMYHSSPTNSNTDGDAYSDYDEVTSYNTDPSNPDTTKPTILSFFPSNNYQRVWMP